MLLNENQVKEIEEKIGYAFKDTQLLVTAFTHSSYSNEHPTNDSQTFEFYGDILLNLILVEAILDKTSIHSYNEGALTNLLTSLKNNEYLNSQMKSTGLEKYIITGNGAQISPTKGLADLFESLIAAIYIDSGKNIQETSRVAAKLLQPEKILNAITNGSIAENLKHPVSRLQEWCQKRGFGIPVYEKIENGGVKLTAAGNEATAWGCNYESAKKKAAEKLLAIFENSTSQIISENQEEQEPSVDLSDETTEIDENYKPLEILQSCAEFITEPHPISRLNLIKQKIDPYGKFGMYVTYDQKHHYLYMSKNLNHFIYKCSLGFRNSPAIPEIITYGEGINSSEAKYNAAQKMLNIIMPEHTLATDTDDNDDYDDYVD